MREIVNVLRTLLKIACLVIIDLLAFYASLFIAWVLRSEVLSSFVADLPAFDQFSYLYFLYLPPVDLVGPDIRPLRIHKADDDI